MEKKQLEKVKNEHEPKIPKGALYWWGKGENFE